MSERPRRNKAVPFVTRSMGWLSGTVEAPGFFISSCLPLRGTHGESVCCRFATRSVSLCGSSLESSYLWMRLDAHRFSFEVFHLLRLVGW